MPTQPTSNGQRPLKPEWYAKTAQYAKPETGKAVLQILNSFVPYIFLIALMILSVTAGAPYAVTLALAVVATVFFTRIFIIFHDCTHNSFLASSRVNRVIGYVAGILTFTPFDDWRRTHGGHHVRAGDLDRRGMGDVKVMTVEEYQRASFWERLGYRLYRNPLIMFGLGPGWVFIIRNRFPFREWRKRDLYSVLFTNLVIFAIIGVAAATIGLGTYLAVQLPVLLIAATLGVWLFYIQHNFQGVYWARHEEVDPIRVALEGASFYKLPKWLQWATGNIGLHHLHHVRPGIPNYRLQECLDAIPELRVPPLTIRESLHCVRLKLFDEKTRRMVGFSSAAEATAVVPEKSGLSALPRFLEEMWNVFLLHAVAAHVNNGLIPSAAFLLLLALITGDIFLDRTVLHLLIIALCTLPVSFFSGVRDWRRNFGAGRAPVFYRKMKLASLLFMLLACAVVTRLALPDMAGASLWIYSGCVFSAFPLVVLLGHYGAKLASVRKQDVSGK